MKIDKEFLDKIEPCKEGLKWAEDNNLIGLDAIDFLNKLIEANKLDWANWLIVRVMDRPKYLAYAIYAAEQVIYIFESKYPEDKRPRLAIEAAKKVLKDDIEDNRRTAYAAADNVFYAAYAAAAAVYAAAAAAYATAAYAAAAAAYATAAYAAADNVFYAVYAADAAKYGMQLKILNYGLDLLKEHEIKG